MKPFTGITVLASLTVLLSSSLQPLLAAAPGPPAPKTLDVTVPPSNLSADCAQLQQAKKEFVAGDTDRAVKTLQAARNDAGLSVSQQRQILSALAAFAFGAEDYNSSIDLLNKLKKLDDADTASTVRSKALCHRRIGLCHLKLNQFDDAAEELQQALTILGTSDATLTIDTLSHLTGCYCAEDKLVEAEKKATELVAACKPRLGRFSSLADFQANVCDLWAQIYLAMIYARTGRPDKQNLQSGVIMDKLGILMGIRQQKVTGGVGATPSDLRNYVKQELSSLAGGSFSEELWVGFDSNLKSLPLAGWRDKSKSPWAIVLCIHGLGLDNTSFESLGNLLASKGLLVLAIDVRGFGSWSTMKALDTVDFDRSLKDIGTVLRWLKQNSPDRPIFLLGESMGGGIAVRSTSMYPNLLNGTISSVAGAQRFNSGSTNLQVARRMLTHPKTPFDVGTKIVKQASAENEALQNSWFDSPKSRLNLSPRELLSFDQFMKDNLDAAATITDTPMLVIQGSEDKLVKPASTYALFDAMKTRDKTMLVLGKFGHIIFELNQFDPGLIDFLSDWMRVRATIKPKPPADSVK
ncbi:MAG: alpha/beta fold hydrolase [Candidatus Obscuribacterales bacterium]|nr:alpha/beta fold hydrolase [Candidatus Obscuribacterales bacterium]